MIKNIEIFYTGGGITIAEADLNDNQFAVVSSEFPDFLTIYNRDDENEKTYLPENTIVSTHKNNLTPDLKPLYSKMIEKLN